MKYVITDKKIVATPCSSEKARHLRGTYRLHCLFLLVYSLANSSILKMEAIYFFEVHGVTTHKTIFFIVNVVRSKILGIR
jgi:hypothetical protein